MLEDSVCVHELYLQILANLQYSPLILIMKNLNGTFYDSPILSSHMLWLTKHIAVFISYAENNMVYFTLLHPRPLLCPLNNHMEPVDCMIL